MFLSEGGLIRLGSSTTRPAAGVQGRETGDRRTPPTTSTPIPPPVTSTLAEALPNLRQRLLLPNPRHAITRGPPATPSDVHLRSPALPQGHHAARSRPAAPLPGPLHQPPNRSGSPPRAVYNFCSSRKGLVNHDTPRHPQTPTRAPQGSPSTPAPQRLLPSSPARGSRGQQSRAAERAVVAPMLCRCRSPSLKPLSVMSPPGTPPKLETPPGPRWPQAGMAPWPSGRWPHVASPRWEGT